MKPRIRRQDYGYTASDGQRELIVEVGWPRLHVRRIAHFHRWKGEETKYDDALDLVVGPVRGVALSASIATGCYPDTDEEGWPE